MFSIARLYYAYTRRQIKIINHDRMIFGDFSVNVLNWNYDVPLYLIYIILTTTTDERTKNMAYKKKLIGHTKNKKNKKFSENVRTTTTMMNERTNKQTHDRTKGKSEKKISEKSKKTQTHQKKKKNSEKKYELQKKKCAKNVKTNERTNKLIVKSRNDDDDDKRTNEQANKRADKRIFFFFKWAKNVRKHNQTNKQKVWKKEWKKIKRAYKQKKKGA